MRGTLAIVLAAGKGVRMKSELPKVLVPVCGRPMLEYVLAALDGAGIADQVVVVGYRAELVQAAVGGRPGVRFAVQAEQLGTGHAVMCCREQLEGHDGAVMVLNGDGPLTQPATLRAMLAEFARTRPACLLGTVCKENPAGLGRVLRDAAGDFVGIVEDKDATPAQRRIGEVNMNYYVFHGPDLLDALDHLRADNAQREYYLTDVPGLLRARGKTVQALCTLQPCEALAINTVDELAAVEAAMQSGA